MLEKLLSVDDAAALLGVSKYTLRSWIRGRRFTHVRLGRRVLIPAAALAAEVRKNTVPARDAC